MIKDRLNSLLIDKIEAFLPVTTILVKLGYKQANMVTIVIDKKKYVLIPENDFKALQKKAALKTKPEKLLTIDDARTHSKKLITQWASENLSLQNPK